MTNAPHLHPHQQELIKRIVAAYGQNTNELVAIRAGGGWIIQHPGWTEEDTTATAGFQQLDLQALESEGLIIARVGSGSGSAIFVIPTPLATGIDWEVAP